jgi:putative DNA primase/helicase
MKDADANDILRASGADGLRKRFDSALVNGSEPLLGVNTIPAGRSSKPIPSANLVRVSSVEKQPINWLWRSRVALGKVTMIAGNPGLGKSQLTTFLAAQVTNGGRWPAGEGQAPKGSVLMLSAEDDVGDTIRPRLEAAGADVDRVHMLTAIRDADAMRGFNLARDLLVLESVLAQIGDVRFVSIDPITAYLGGTDTHKTADVRAVLAPVSDLAAKHGVAIVAVSHLNKGSGGDAMGRITGSVAFVAAARAAFLIQKDPEDAKRRLFLPVKNNLGTDDTGLAFRIVEKDVGSAIRAPAIEWEDERVTISADEALAAASANDGEEGGALREAVEFLRDALAGGPVSRKTIKTDASANGVSEKTLRRAKSRLGVVTRKMGMKEGWIWEIPTAEDGQADDHLATFEDGHENPKVARQKGMGTFGNLGHLRADCRTPDPCQQQTQIAGTAALGQDLATDIPASYAQQFRALQAACPADVSSERWQLCLGDARRFFGKWGRKAHKLGWTAHDLLGLHPTAPLARHDEMGLLWTLRGQSVVDLGARAAKLSGGLTMRRRSS